MKYKVRLPHQYNGNHTESSRQAHEGIELRRHEDLLFVCLLYLHPLSTGNDYVGWSGLLVEETPVYPMEFFLRTHRVNHRPTASTRQTDEGAQSWD